LTIVRLFEVLAYDRKIIKGQDAIFSPLSMIGAAGNIPFPICHAVLPTFYKFIMRLMHEISAYSRHEDILAYKT
jgi:hypothetical protein